MARRQENESNDTQNQSGFLSRRLPVVYLDSWGMIEINASANYWKY